MKPFSIIRPPDIVLILIIIALSLCSIRFLPGKPGESLCRVFIDGKPHSRIDLAEEGRSRDTLALPCGVMVLEKEGHGLRVSHSCCRNRICVVRGLISRPGESIVCAPNRVFIFIDAGKEEWDGLSR